MKIISFVLGFFIAYFIIQIFIKTKEHGYNSNDVKKILLSDGKIKYRLIPVTYTCIYDINHE
tara:strand:+ start:292 stop:477 length:186 start_codon:yes stop_codon:yes gene_type:complete